MSPIKSCYKKATALFTTVSLFSQFLVFSPQAASAQESAANAPELIETVPAAEPGVLPPDYVERTIPEATSLAPQENLTTSEATTEPDTSLTEADTKTNQDKKGEKGEPDDTGQPPVTEESLTAPSTLQEEQSTLARGFGLCKNCDLKQSNGALHYSYGINIPAGRNGLQPNIATLNSKKKRILLSVMAGI